MGDASGSKQGGVKPAPLKPRQEAFYQRVRALYREAGITVPSLRDASRQIGAPPDAIRAMIAIGIARGEFVDAGEGVYFPIETLQQLAEQLRGLPPPITVAKVRDLTRSSRRYAAAALRWLKRNGWLP
ncbi:MAG: hypothetical protein NZL85_03825 [Fimbriimonadales bacterium]|nr:hypothetical protein [Fimbriimonadales bacterium]